MDTLEEMELRWQLTEAQLEIDRHHRDFQRIRDVLDDAELTPHRRVHFYVTELRNIVG